MKKGIDYIGVTVVFLCHDGKGNILLAKRGAHCRDEHGTWDPGGGGVEFGDTILETLKKEIEEEYCTDVIEYECMGFRDVFREQESIPTHWISFDYAVLVDKKKAHNGEPHKLDAVEWFSLDELPFPQHSQFPYFLEKYKEDIDRIVRRKKTA